MKHTNDDNELMALVSAIDRSSAIIEFEIDGRIITANDQFLDIMGYSIDEIRGKHHRIFVSPEYSESPEYEKFWSRLNAGEYISDELMRLGKGGREIWLQTTYNPVFNSDGKPYKVIKLATDITKQKETSVVNEGVISAIEQTMAVIEFELDGTILRANNIFLDIMGYDSNEVIGKHHRMFVNQEYANSPDYQKFWHDLSLGTFNRGRFERAKKNGESVWLESTYSPIFDYKGNPFKVVKFAYDITSNVEQNLALEAAMSEAQEAERVRNELDRAIQEMSTPVTPIWEGILLLPLVGVLDSMRSSDIMNKSLSMISEMRAKVFVLDISGVATVDTAVANQLIKITKATRLMGCEAIISGLSPAIARTIVELGVNVEEIRTTATLRDAFETALNMIGELVGSGRESESTRRLNRTD